MVGRSANCAECGDRVVLTSAAPVVRAGRIALLCDSCRAPAPGPPDDDYEAIVVEPVPEQDSSDYEAIVLSGTPPPIDESPEDEDVVHSGGRPPPAPSTPAARPDPETVGCPPAKVRPD